MARYFAAGKIRAILDRLREPAASYNTLICGDAFISQAMSIFIVLQLAATADLIRLWEAESSLQHNLEEQDNPEGDRSRFRRQRRIQLARSIMNVLFTIAVTLHLTRVLAPELSEAAALLMALTAASHLVLLEAREQDIFLARTSPPLRSLPLIRFDPLRAGNGHDCPICQDDIGEQEWIYPLPCKHQFHR